MKVKLPLRCLVGAVLFLMSISVFAQSNISANTANLTAPAEQILQNYLTNESPLKAKSSSIKLEVSEDELSKNVGLRTVRALQKYNDVYVLDGLLSLHFNKEGKQLTSDNLINPQPNTTAPAISASDAVHRTMNYFGMPAALNLQLKEEKFTGDGEVIFDRGLIAASDIKVRLMYVTHPKTNQLRLTWETQIHTPDRQHYYITYVDAVDGIIIRRDDMVHSCQFGGHEYDASPEEQAIIDAEHHAMHMQAAYNWDAALEQKKAPQAPQFNANILAPFAYRVLKEPAEAPNDLSAYIENHGDAPDAAHIKFNNVLGVDELVQQDVLMDDAISPNAAANPSGSWHDTPGTAADPTQGNNVIAFFDPSPTPLGGAGPPYIAPTGGQFLVDWDMEQEPEYMSGISFPNRDAAIINLFYWNNLIHDVFYEFDLTSATGAFQNTPAVDGAGVGGDMVLAQAQDSGGTNNANFLTLTDGVSGQMQMYLWTASVRDFMVQVSDGNDYDAIEGALFNATAPPASARVPGPNDTPLTGDLILVNDGCTGTAGTTSSGSEACGTGITMVGFGLPPCNDVTGKIVLIDRGSCSFVEKVHGAQLGMAAAVIVMNNDQANPDAIIAMGGSDAAVNTITIPAVMVSYNTGQLLRQAYAAGESCTLQLTQPAAPKKDGDFDNGIISHEYGHGITTRLSPQTATGGSLSGDEQGGEGWADFIGLYMTTSKADLLPATAEHPNGVLPDRGIGSYIRYTDYTGPGIRPRQYSIDNTADDGDPIVNEYTLAGTSNGGFGIANAPEVVPPHGVGFVWCTMLWEVTQLLIDEYGLTSFQEDPKRLFRAPSALSDMKVNGGTADGMNMAMRLIMKGIELQEPSPTFIEMRDGILNADTMLFGGEHGCLLWEAFAKRGLGFDAVDPDNSLGNEIDGYSLHPNCIPDGAPGQIYYSIDKTAPTVMENQQNLTYTISVTNTSPTGDVAEDVSVTDVLPTGVNVVSASSVADPMLDITATIDATENSATWTIASLPANKTAELTVVGNLQLTETSKILTEYTFESGDEGWTDSSVGANNSFSHQSDGANSHDGTGNFYCPNSGGIGIIVTAETAPATLVSPVLPTGTNRQLRFWHKYDTDSGYDGGFVEVSADNGSSWSKLTIEEHPYTGSLDGTFNPLNPGAAYTGASPYIESAAFLTDNITNVRFVFSEDIGGGTGEGWWLDDIKIVENPIISTNTVSITDPTGGRVKESSVSTLILGDPAEADALSVRLLDLTATARKDDIQLDWATATEVENRGFYVERLADNNEWTTLGFVKGQGTTNTVSEYTFNDADVVANKLYVYRLRQVDTNGRETLSYKVSARIIGNVLSMNIVPNPASDLTNVRIVNATPNSQLRLLNVTGQLIRSYEVGTEVNQTIPVQIDDLAAGIYLIQLQTNDGLLVQKLTVE